MKVLDHGHVELIDYMGSDHSVVRAARVSYAKASLTGIDEEKDNKLLKYLWKNKHTTPFEVVTFTFYVKAPIFVFRQWHRHRTQSYNEISARYTELPEEFYIPDLNVIGVQCKHNKQSRVFKELDQYEQSYQADMIRNYEEHCKTAFLAYKDLLEAGWPRELARAVLPVSTYSGMFTTMNLLNFLRFATLRCDESAQYEIRQYTKAMVELVRPIVPVTIEAWEEFK